MTNTSWSGNRTTFPTSTRRKILQRDPVCVLCHTRPATIADHQPNYVTLVRMGVEDPHNAKYGQGVCEPCHDVKTRGEQQAGRDLKRRPPRAHPGHTTR